MSAVHLEYTRTQVLPLNAAASYTYSAYFDSGRLYQLRRDGTPAGNAVKDPSQQEVAFDGKVFFFGNPDVPGDAPAVLVKYSVADRTDPTRLSLVIDIPYLNAAGFYCGRYSEPGGFCRRVACAPLRKAK